MMWSFFPWPVLFVIPTMIVMGVFMAVRMVHGHSATGCGSAPSSPPPRHWEVEVPTPPPAPEDPMSTLRRRLVDGEIGLPEFEARPDALLRTDPSLSMPWWDQPTDATKATR